MSFFNSRWVPAGRKASASCPAEGYRSASAPPGSRAASSPRARVTSGCSSATPRQAPARRFHAFGNPLGAGRTRPAPRRSRPGCAPDRQLRQRQRARQRGSRSREDEGAAAIACGVPESAVAVASTGVIGVPLPMDVIGRRGAPAAAHQLRSDGERDFADAIRTTDAFEKRVTLRGGAGGRHRSDQRSGEGRGHDLAALRDVAGVDPDRARCSPRGVRPAAVGDRQTLVQRISVDGSCRPRTR